MFRTAIEAACTVAHKLGTKALTVVADNDRPGVGVEAMHRLVVAGLGRAATIAEHEDLPLLLEPLNGRVDHPGHCSTEVKAV